VYRVALILVIESFEVQERSSGVIVAFPSSSGA
jgi:hypothetical protein